MTDEVERARAALRAVLVGVRIDRPHVYPTPAGGIQAEWDLPHTTVDLELIPRPEGVVFEGIATRDAIKDLDATADLDTVIDWLRRVAPTLSPEPSMRIREIR